MLRWSPARLHRSFRYQKKPRCSMRYLYPLYQPHRYSLHQKPHRYSLYRKKHPRFLYWLQRQYSMCCLHPLHPKQRRYSLSCRCSMYRRTQRNSPCLLSSPYQRSSQHCSKQRQKKRCLLRHPPHDSRRLHWPKRRWRCRNLRHRPPAFRYHPVQMMPPQLPNFRHLRMLPNLRPGPHSWRPTALRRCHPSRNTPAGRSMSPSCPPA